MRVSAQRVGSQADIRVVDDGEGIAPELLPHIFEAFRQAEDAITTRAHGGLGLGLAICQQLVEQHGGSIHAASEGRGRGALFVVRLPLPEKEAGTAPRTPPAALVSYGPVERRLVGRRILLVEDEVATRAALATVISEAGADVTTAETAQAALEAYQRQQPDLLISDIGMAGIDGYQMMQRLRAIERSCGQNRPVPALALTAFASRADAERALSAGFTLHLAKPVVPEQLIGTLQALIDGDTPPVLAA